MEKICKLLVISACMLFAGHAVSQPAPTPRIAPLQLKTAPPAINTVNPAVITRIAPGAATLAVDPEGQVQAEIKRQVKKRDAISVALAQVNSNFSKLTFTPVTGNSCVDPDTTWNARSGESFTCSGLTTCIGRMSRWSKSRTNPCEPGVSIDSCVITDECKTGSVCDTGAKKCVRTQ